MILRKAIFILGHYHTYKPSILTQLSILTVEVL